MAEDQMNIKTTMKKDKDVSVAEISVVESPLKAETVTVTVPKAYILRNDTHAEVHIKAGVQEMSLVDASHWYSVANGVTIYSKG